MTDEIQPPAAPPPSPAPVEPTPAPENDRPGRSTMQAGFVTSIVAFCIAWIPFAGYLGLIAIMLGASGRARYDREGNAKIIATCCFGGLALIAAAFWTYLAATASCPHVYAWDGQAWRLDADMLSGSLYRGAESDDVDRLESLVASEGQYRVRIANERQEVDFVDSAALEIVDHPAGTSALPTPDNQVVLLGELKAPLQARDVQGRDLLPTLLAEDALGWRGDPAAHAPERETKPRDSFEVTLPAVPGPAYLVLRAHNTEEGTQALYRYLAQMGPGVGTLLSLAESDCDYPYAQRLHGELARMGVPLVIERGLEGGAWQTVHELRPIGPATLRSIAIPLPPLGDGEIRLRLTAIPAAWEIDRVAIAAASTEPTTRTLAKARGLDAARADVAQVLGASDGQRVRLDQGEHVDLAFDAPAPAPGTARSALLHLRGYYDVQIGGRAWLNPIALWRHRTQEDAAARFFLESLGKQD